MPVPLRLAVLALVPWAALFIWCCPRNQGKHRTCCGQYKCQQWQFGNLNDTIVVFRLKKIPLSLTWEVFTLAPWVMQLHILSVQGILKREVSLYHWPPVWLVWNQLHDNWQFSFYFQNRLWQISQTGGQWYSDNSPFSIPWSIPYVVALPQNSHISTAHVAFSPTVPPKTAPT